tara:strand:+ start:125 stop:1255 length:1131 start_codon:yes stop_codon:yes gene_type:complete
MTNTVKLKRGSGSDPSASDMVVGEPVIRTDTAELFFKKDDGSVAKVSGGGGGPDFKYLALRNAANNGSASYPGNDFTLVTSGTTNAITPAAANTLLVSYGGVIQRPNSGTSTSGITGFIVDGSRFKTATNLAAAPDFILYQESGGIGEPSDGTVTEAKLSVSNNPTNGYFLSAQSGNTGGLTWAAISQYSTPLTTQGDILFRDGSGDQRLAAGTSGYFLKTQGSGADPVWAAVPAGVGGASGVDFNDNVKARWGTGNDLEVFHDGSNSRIEDTGTGYLAIRSNNIRFENPAANEALLYITENAGIELYHDNTKRIETSTTGATVTGVATVSNGIVETAATIATNHTITSNYNAMSAGPVTVSATVTVPSGSAWVIV